MQSLVSQATEAREVCTATRARFVLKLPRILHDDELDRILPGLEQLQREGLTACMSENPGISCAVVRACPGITLHGGPGLNIFNHAAACLSTPRYDCLTISSELSQEEAERIIASARGKGAAMRFALFVQGSSEALVTEDCIPRLALRCTKGDDRFFGLRDETGRVFPLYSGGDCRTRIANSSELCLIDMLPQVRDAGIAEIIIDTRHRPPAYAREMTALYREAADTMNARGGAPPDEKLRHLKERVKAIAPGGITAGHFVRGLKE